MTHTLHRQGDSLKEDYVVLIMSAKGINEAGSSKQLARALKILQETGAVNLGDMKTGNSYCINPKEIINRVSDQSIVHGVYTNKRDLGRALATLRGKELGMSVVVSGLFDEAFGVASKVDLKPHTVNVSLGVWGRKKVLPNENYLRICTMCGHGMISPFLVHHITEQIKEQRMTVDEAVRKLSECCVCGAFNPVRATKLIKELIGN
jgi:hypothetical protein